MDSFLAVFKKTKGKLSLSCGDLATLESAAEYDQSNLKQQSKDSRDTSSCRLTRFLRPKSPDSLGCTMSRGNSCCELVNNIDDQLAEIREKLAMFRKQDTKFRERMDSLSHSIGELASGSSLNSEDPMIFDSDTEEQNFEEAEINGKISSSFSTEVLNSIPTIKVTYYAGKRRLSDPSIYEASRLLKSSVASQRYNAYSTDQIYLCNEVATIL